MKIRIENAKEGKYILQEGDIVYFEGDNDCYMVIKEDNRFLKEVIYDQYTLRSMTRDLRANGFFNNLEGLTDSLCELGEYQIFKASEYQLILTRKNN